MSTTHNNEQSAHSVKMCDACKEREATKLDCTEDSLKHVCDKCFIERAVVAWHNLAIETGKYFDRSKAKEPWWSEDLGEK
jgi:hypothetical protein